MVQYSALMLGVLIATAGASALASPAAAQDGRTRQDVARRQGVPPGHLPPPDLCRVWYDDRPNGQQPSPTSCARAESTAARNRNARVIYGENAFDERRNWRDDNRGEPGDGRYADRDRDHDRDRGRDRDRAVPRGSVRDPRLQADTSPIDERDGGSVAFRNGYRDGFSKGREDVEKGVRYDPARHRWHRQANRGYDYRHPTRYDYIARYRSGFVAGYAEGYRYDRRR